MFGCLILAHRITAPALGQCWMASLLTRTISGVVWTNLHSGMLWGKNSLTWFALWVALYGWLKSMWNPGSAEHLVVFLWVIPPSATCRSVFHWLVTPSYGQSVSWATDVRSFWAISCPGHSDWPLATLRHLEQVELFTARVNQSISSCPHINSWHLMDARKEGIGRLETCQDKAFWNQQSMLFRSIVKFALLSWLQSFFYSFIFPQHVALPCFAHVHLNSCVSVPCHA